MTPSHILRPTSVAGRTVQEQGLGFGVIRLIRLKPQKLNPKRPKPNPETPETSNSQFEMTLWILYYSYNQEPPKNSIGKCQGLITS